jgi:hypothetical protein
MRIGHVTKKWVSELIGWFNDDKNNDNNNNNNNNNKINMPLS